MNVTDRKFLTSTLVAVAGCKAVTFRAWRNRNGLFPETKESGGWNHFSIVDMCVARSVVVMTEHGLPVDDAVWQAGKWFRAYFLVLLRGEKITHLHGFLRGPTVETGEPVAHVDEITGEVSPELPKHWAARTSASFIGIGDEQSVSEIVGRTQSGVITIIDLRSIIEHVVGELRELDPETVLTGKETLELIAARMANALRPSTSDEEDAK